MPDKGPSPHLIMPDINITAAGILNLLQNLDVHKASGPDQVSSRILKETAEFARSMYDLALFIFQPVG